MPVLWVALVVIFAAGATYRNWSSFSAEYERDGALVHRIISQRADQHDAHMTSISALALATDPPPREAMGLVFSSIEQFYPRITAIDLVTFGAEPPASVISTRQEAPEQLARLISEAAQQGTQKPSLRAGTTPGTYLLIKRVPNTASPKYALALEIDAARLTEMDSVPVPASEIELLMPDGTTLWSSAKLDRPATWSRPDTMTFRKTLGSASQPLLLQLRREFSLASIVPWNLIALFGLLTAAALLAYRKYSGARAAAREARALAAFSEQEVRLAHASRINAMGELSLGIAHELTQPLTAILSQSQAGLQMIGAEPADRTAIAGVLEANVRHARRAGKILGKLRDWVSAKPGGAAPVDINRVISEVVALTRNDLEKRNVMTRLALATPPPVVMADPIELEQIVYNLLSNAADASARADGSPAIVHLRTFEDALHIGLEVHDDGQGLTPDAMQKIFEPFFSSKPGGMGLGLTLCQRLAERFGGQIKVANHADGGAVFTVLLPAARAAQRPAHLAAE
jgi:signal transduction histidine kinase